MPFFVIPFPVIDPVLVEIGPFPIRWYGLAYVAGLLLGWLYARALVKRETLWGGARHPSAQSLDDLLVYCALGVIIGGRLGNVLFYDFGYYLTNPLKIFAVWEGGMAFHGGLIGACIAIWLFARREKAPLLSVTDICASVVPIGIFFGRLANFIKPEMWGRPSDVSWAMIFPDAGPLARHPSQLYEAGLEGLLLLVLLALAVRAGALARPGLVTGLFGAGYALARTFSEIYREPDPRSEAIGNGDFTMGMALSAPLLLIGGWLIIRALRRRAVDAA